MRLRNDILRGVRLFLIAFAAILFGYWVYQMLRPAAEVQGAPQDATPTPEAVQPGPTSAEASGEPHGLVVPAPPPAGGVPAPPPKSSRPRSAAPAATATNTVSPAPVQGAPAFSGREFETPQVSLPPSTSATESAESNPGSSKSGVGYKSLLEANPTRSLIEAAPMPVADQPVEKPKGNRFARALGRVFKGGKKETLPLTLQQPKPE